MATQNGAVEAVVINQRSFDTVDDYLGPRDQRFFGEGFKRSTHRLTDVDIDADGHGGTVAATVCVEYPVDWSKKGQNDQRAHLSTVDVLVLGARLIETYLERVHGLTSSQLDGAVLEHASIKAGSTPVEDDLARFPAVAHITSAKASDGTSVITVSECEIGTLSLRCQVRHHSGTQAPSTMTSQHIDALSDLGPRLFAENFRSRKQFLDAVRIDPQRQQARSVVRIESPQMHLSSSALAVDTFVVGLQLGQVLLYELDGLDRAASGTLWMRRTTFECRDETAMRAVVAPAVTRLENIKLIEKSPNQVWRVADIVCEFQQLKTRCSVAHRIR